MEITDIRILLLLSERLNGGNAVLSRVLDNAKDLLIFPVRSNIDRGHLFKMAKKITFFNILYRLIDIKDRKPRILMIYTHILTIPLFFFLMLFQCRHVWICQGLELTGTKFEFLQSIIIKLLSLFKNRIKIICVSDQLSLELRKKYHIYTEIVEFPLLLLNNDQFEHIKINRSILVHLRMQSIRTPNVLKSVIEKISTDYKIHIVCEDEAARKFIEKINLTNIVLIMKLDRVSYTQILAKCNFFLYFSKYEGYCLPAFEAILCGTLPVGPNVGALESYLGVDYPGFTIELDYVSALKRLNEINYSVSENVFKKIRLKKAEIENGKHDIGYGC